MGLEGATGSVWQMGYRPPRCDQGRVECAGCGRGMGSLGWDLRLVSLFPIIMNIRWSWRRVTTCRDSLSERDGGIPICLPLPSRRSLGLDFDLLLGIFDLAFPKHLATRSAHFPATGRCRLLLVEVFVRSLYEFNWLSRQHPDHTAFDASPLKAWAIRQVI